MPTPSDGARQAGNRSFEATAATDVRTDRALGRLTWVLIVCVGAIWLLSPLLLNRQFAADGAAFLAAGSLAQHHPNDVYAVDGAPTPRFAATACSFGPHGRDCEQYAPPFTSPPQLIPILELFNVFHGKSAIFILRSACVGFMICGVAAGIRRVVGDGGADTRTLMWILVTAVAVTPLVLVTVGLGQVTGLMLISVLHPLAADRKQGRATARCSLLLIGLFKLFPLGLYVDDTRRRETGIAVAIVAVLSIVVAHRYGPGIFADFLNSSRGNELLAHPWNLSIDGAMARAFPSWRIGSDGYIFGIATRIFLLGLLWWAKVRHATPSLRWAWLWCAVVLISPLVWSHYMIAPLGVFMVTLSQRLTADSPRARLRRIRQLAAVSVVTVPIALGTPSWVINLAAVAYVVGAFIVITRAVVSAERRSMGQQTPAPT